MPGLHQAPTDIAMLIPHSAQKCYPEQLKAASYLCGKVMPPNYNKDELF